MRPQLLLALALAALTTTSPRASAADDRPVLIVVGMSNEASAAAGPGAAVVISAGNADLLRQRLAAYGRADVRAVISFGIAGGLDPAAKPGDLYLAKRVTSLGGAWNTDSTLGGALAKAARAAGLKVHRGLDVGQDQITTIDPASRLALRRLSGADLVDGESQVAAAFAAQEGLPFAVVRVIADPASATLPPAALLPLLPNGAPDGGAILKSIAGNLGQIPALISLAFQEGKAMEVLRRIRGRFNAEQLP